MLKSSTRPEIVEQKLKWTEIISKYLYIYLTFTRLIFVYLLCLSNVCQDIKLKQTLTGQSATKHTHRERENRKPPNTLHKGCPKRNLTLKFLSTSRKRIIIFYIYVYKFLISENFYSCIALFYYITQMWCMVINVFFWGLVGATSDALALNEKPDKT